MTYAIYCGILANKHDSLLIEDGSSAQWYASSSSIERALEHTKELLSKGYSVAIDVLPVSLPEP